MGSKVGYFSAHLKKDYSITPGNNAEVFLADVEPCGGWSTAQKARKREQETRGVQR